MPSLAAPRPASRGCYEAELEFPFGSLLLRVDYRRDGERPAEIVVLGAEICDRIWDRAHRRFRDSGPWRDGAPLLALLSPALAAELRADIAAQAAEQADE